MLCAHVRMPFSGQTSSYHVQHVHGKRFSLDITETAAHMGQPSSIVVQYYLHTIAFDTLTEGQIRLNLLSGGQQIVDTTTNLISSSMRIDLRTWCGHKTQSMRLIDDLLC